MQLLLGAGADAELARPSTGVTPLIAAAGKGHADVVVALLGAGADVAATSSSGSTAVFAAAQHGHAGVLRALLGIRASAGDGGGGGAAAAVNTTADGAATPLFVAAQNGHLGAARLLLNAGAAAALDDADEAGVTPLCAAVREGAVEVVHELLSRGADPERRDNDGGPHGMRWSTNVAAPMPRLPAVSSSIPTVRYRRVRPEAESNASGRRADTVLQVAAEGGDCAVLAALIRAGAKLRATTRCGLTALAVASLHRHASAIAMLARAEWCGDVGSQRPGSPTSPPTPPLSAQMARSKSVATLNGPSAYSVAAAPTRGGSSGGKHCLRRRPFGFFCSGRPHADDGEAPHTRLTTGLLPRRRARSVGCGRRRRRGGGRDSSVGSNTA
eukprot:SAG11_NODE_1758_length_4306_cov_2.946993_5_plen_385_part_00